MRRLFTGWRPDRHDERDFVFAAPRPSAEGLPPSVDLSRGFPRHYDQASTNSCVGNSVAALVDFTDKEQDDGKEVIPSRRFIYYAACALDGYAGVDQGTTIRSAFQALGKVGYAREALCQFRTDLITSRPSAEAFRDAGRRKLGTRAFFRVARTEDALRSALAANNPVVFGFTCYESLGDPQVAKTGMVPMPKKGEKVEGGHAVVLCGYDKRRGMFTFKNSWGRRWGIDGHGFLRDEFVLSPNCSDFWTLVEVPA